MTKQFLACVNWLITCLRFQNMFGKNIDCFRFWWKTYTKRSTSNNVISRVKRLSSMEYWVYWVRHAFFPCTLRLVRCFQFWIMIWKTEERRVSKRGCLCDNWKLSFLPLLIFNWHTFSRQVTTRWWRQWAKNQVLTNQNSKNRWCQIVRRIIWKILHWKHGGENLDFDFVPHLFTLLT